MHNAIAKRLRVQVRYCILFVLLTVVAVLTIVQLLRCRLNVMSDSIDCVPSVHADSGCKA